MFDTYRIIPGDTLSGIARATRTMLADLIRWNRIRDPNRIRAGHVLRILRAANPAASCPVDRFTLDNLKLGINTIYVFSIGEAADCTGLAPQTVAAIIDAEAAKAPNGRWLPISRAATSSAAGLTQFLDATWLGEATRAGGVLNAEAKALGLIDAGDRCTDSPRLLALRFDPRVSILAGADFARENLTRLRKARLIDSGASPAALAKLAYLAHHEGPSRAIRFLRGDMSYVSDSLFRANLGLKARVRYLTAANGNRGDAYRNWLIDYTNRCIDVRRFMKEADGVEVVSLGSFCT